MSNAAASPFLISKEKKKKRTMSATKPIDVMDMQYG